MNQKARETASSFGLLVLRLGAGGLLLYGHGWSKLVHFSDRASGFADPLHVGAPASLALAVFGEVLCAAALMLGLGTRLAAAALTFQFVVITFVVHGDDPFKQRELAMLFGAAFLTLLLTGPGGFSLDAWLGRRLGGRGKS